MRARQVWCGALMLASLGLAVGAYRLGGSSTHPTAAVAERDLIHFALMAVAVATFMSAWVAGWFENGILGNKRKSLLYVFLLCFFGYLLLGLGPIIAASALGKDEAWVSECQTYGVIAICGWQVLRAVRQHRVGTRPGSH